MNASSQPVDKLLPLTSLRFFAAACILVHHLPGHFGITRNEVGPVAWDNGVSFFFVLSGFILTYVYAGRTAFERAAFLATRLARLWPAHLAAFLLLWLLAPEVISAGFSPARLLSFLTLTQSWLPSIDYNFFLRRARLEHFHRDWLLRCFFHYAWLFEKGLAGVANSESRPGFSDRFLGQSYCSTVPSIEK